MMLPTIRNEDNSAILRLHAALPLSVFWRVMLCTQAASVVVVAPFIDLKYLFLGIHMK
jgi:hypothetical protein